MHIYNSFICSVIRNRRKDILEKIKPEYILDSKYQLIYKTLIENSNKGYIWSEKELKMMYPDIKWEESNVKIDDLSEAIISKWAEQKLRDVFQKYAIEDKNVKDIVKELKDTLVYIDKMLSDSYIEVNNVLLDLDMDWYKKRIDKKSFKVSWNTLNDVLGGLVNGKFWVIIGRMKVGKTFFLLKMAYDIWMQEKARVLFCSGEMNVDEIKLRLISIASKIPYDILQKGKVVGSIYEDFYRRYIDYISRFTNEFYVVGFSKVNIFDVIERYIADKKVDVVFIDSFYRFGIGKDEYTQVGYAAAEIARLCKEYDIPIVVTSQFNKEGSKIKIDNDTDAFLNVAFNLNIVRLADVVIGLFTDKNLKALNRMYVAILLSRYTADGHKFAINWDITNMNFDEVNMGSIVDEHIEEEFSAIKNGSV